MTVKRSIYLINPKFQLKFSLFVSSLVLISSLIYPFAIYYLIERLVITLSDQETISKLALDPTAITQSLSQQQGHLITLLTIFHLAFIALVFIICIFQSHKIAGPMYKLQRYLANIKKGNPTDHLFFRKGDNFPEIADDFNEAFNKIQETHNSDFAYIGEVSNYIDSISSYIPEEKKDVLNNINLKLSEIQERFKTK